MFTKVLRNESKSVTSNADLLRNRALETGFPNRTNNLSIVVWTAAGRKPQTNHRRPRITNRPIRELEWSVSNVSCCVESFGNSIRRHDFSLNVTHRYLASFHYTSIYPRTIPFENGIVAFILTRCLR